MYIDISVVCCSCTLLRQESKLAYNFLMFYISTYHYHLVFATFFKLDDKIYGGAFEILILDCSGDISKKYISESGIIIKDDYSF